MHVSVIGAGYVGLVTAACFADVGNIVLCVDIDPHKVEKLKRSEIPIHEPGLEQLVERNVAAGRLRFSTSYDDAVSHATLDSLSQSEPPRARMARPICRTSSLVRESLASASSAIR